MPDMDHNGSLEPLHEIVEYGQRHASALPAAEVRTRGTRRHRQRITLTIAGAAVLVAAIGAGSVAGGAALLSHDSEPVLPGPTTTTTTTTTSPTTTTSDPTSTSSSTTSTPTSPLGPSWADAIPADFVMDDGLSGDTYGERTVSDQLDTPWAIDLCGSTSYPTDDSRVDFRTIDQPVPAAHEVRQLGLYPDAEAAQQVIDDFQRKLSDCPRVPGDPPDPQFPDKAIVWEKRAYDAGDASLVIVNVLMYSTLADHFAVVRVGNAVYLQTTRGEWGGGGPEHALHDQIDAEVRPYADAVAARMCIFAADPC